VCLSYAMMIWNLLEGASVECGTLVFRSAEVNKLLV